MLLICIYIVKSDELPCSYRLSIFFGELYFGSIFVSYVILVLNYVSSLYILINLSLLICLTCKCVLLNVMLHFGFLGVSYPEVFSLLLALHLEIITGGASGNHTGCRGLNSSKLHARQKSYLLYNCSTNQFCLHINIFI